MPDGPHPRGIFSPRRQPLDVFFDPATVAVIGASEAAGSVGRALMENLARQPGGRTLFPVNPRRPSVLGIKACPRVTDVPQPVDLAVIATPAPTVPDVVGQCIDAGVRGAIILSAGFKECGPAGVKLEEQIKAQLRPGGLRVVGPNCLGVLSPHTGLNATFAPGTPLPGRVGLISQSGALLATILAWGVQENVGFSRVISAGSMLDVGWGDFIDYLSDDPHTHSILLYMEAVGDARSFLSAARAVAQRKPVIVIKAGRTEVAARAAASHTGALTGSDEVYEAAFRRAGVLRVATIEDLFGMAEVLAKQPAPRGPRLTILTNAGGPGVLATDALIKSGGRLAPLAPETVAALDQVLPEHWSHMNPVDVLGDATPERYAKAVEIAARDPNSDGLLMIMTPAAMSDPAGTAERLVPHARAAGKPVLASWMWGPGAAEGVAVLNRADIPTFPVPEAAVQAFDYLWRYGDNLKSLYETPVLPAEPEGAALDRALAGKIIRAARQAGRTLLTEHESKLLLDAYGLPTVSTCVARTEEEAVAQAGDIGYPVVLKVHSETIPHKSDVGGVRLDLAGPADVRHAFQVIRSAVSRAAGPEHFAGVTVQAMVKREGYEVILGSSVDSQFGPVLLFGTGGRLVEVFQDRALALPPLNTTLAQRLMERTKIFAAFRGVRGSGPVDLDALRQLLVRFSQLVVEQPWVKEIDINPLLVSPEGAVALDARVVLHGPEVRPGQLPRPAIRPYPVRYVAPWRLKDGTPVTLRPIRPEDEPLLARFHETLTDHSVYLRYFQALKLSQRVAHERLARLCFIDYDREMALVAERTDPRPGGPEILGVGRIIKLHGAAEAEFAVLVSPPYHRCGLGTELLRRLLQVGRDEKLRRISGQLLPENYGMRRVCEKLGFRLEYAPGEAVVTAELAL
jgi:acetyltransferase